MDLSPSPRSVPVFSRVPTPHRITRADFLTALFVGLAALALYTWTMMPSVAAGDNAELTVAIHYMGIAHAPCYPLHSFLGKLFTFLPISTVAWRANFFSAFSGATSVFLTVLVLIKLLSSYRVPRLHALIAGGAAGVFWTLSQFLWSQSIKCEIFAMSAVFYPAFMLMLLRWADKVVERRNDAVPYFGEKYLLGFSFLYGVSLGGHQTILPAGFFFMLFILAVLLENQVLNRLVTPRQIGQGLALLGLLVLLLAVAFGFYFKFIVSLKSNLYDVFNVQVGMITFVLANVALLGVYLWYRVIAPDSVDRTNPLTHGFFVAVKMFMMLYLGYAIFLYMLIRAHGNPPINWMGINEVEDWWLKFGKFFNAIWRKQYGDMGKMPFTWSGIWMDTQLLFTSLHARQFTVPVYLLGLAGAVVLWFRSKFWLAITVLGFVAYSLVMVPFLRYMPDEQALFFVNRFFGFSYWLVLIPVTAGAAALLAGFDRLFAGKKA